MTYCYILISEHVMDNSSFSCTVGLTHNIGSYDYFFFSTSLVLLLFVDGVFSFLSFPFLNSHGIVLH